MRTPFPLQHNTRHWPFSTHMLPQRLPYLISPHTCALLRVHREHLVPTSEAECGHCGEDERGYCWAITSSARECSVSPGMHSIVTSGMTRPSFLIALVNLVIVSGFSSLCGLYYWLSCAGPSPQQQMVLNMDAEFSASTSSTSVYADASTIGKYKTKAELKLAELSPLRSSDSARYNWLGVIVTMSYVLWERCG